MPAGRSPDRVLTERPPGSPGRDIPLMPVIAGEVDLEAIKKTIERDFVEVRLLRPTNGGGR